MSLAHASLPNQRGTLMAERPSGGESNRIVATGVADDDPRLAFIYQEAVRGLIQQQTLVENMSTRAGSLIFATAFANSLLGGAAFPTGLGFGTGPRWPCCSASAG
jgi:hypothetical protein